MWILSPLQPEGETHYLQSGKNYVVGRKNCDILLSEDQSISRAHAQISSTDQTLTVKDTSKYGTFVNEQRLSENTPVILTSGSNITFGVFNSKFRVEPLRPVVCSSCLDNSGKASLSEALKLVGGKLVGTWSQECTHLVMSKVKVTIKTISALLTARPIVTPEFFSALHEAVQKKSAPPEADRFLPEINEPRSFLSGKPLFFLNAKQMSRLRAAVTYGGGSCRLLEEGSLPRDVLESPQSCVIDVTSAASQTVLSLSTVAWVNSVKSIVEKFCSQSKSRIPSASLSQSLTVDETVLPAPSMNITAYAANTEPTQGLNIRDVSGVSAVGETPERRQKTTTSATKKKTESPFFVPESEISFNAAVQTESKHTVEESKLTEDEPENVPTENKDFWIISKTIPAKTVVTHQLLSAINKKRQLEDDITAETSQSKRPALDNKPTTSQPQQTSKETHSAKLSTDLSRSSREATGNKTQGQKRKEQDEIELEELESIMSEEMDFDEPPPRSQSQSKVNHPKPQKEFSGKRQRLQEQVDEKGKRKIQPFDLEKPSTSSKTPVVNVKEQNVSINIDSFEQSDKASNNSLTVKKKSRLPFTDEGMDFVEDEELLQATEIPIKPAIIKPDVKKPNGLSAKTPALKNKNRLPFTDVGSDFVEDEELLKAESSEVPVKPAVIKQEVKESKMDNTLPKSLLLVEFRDLKVNEPPMRTTKQKQSNGLTKNFKCFRKVQVRGLVPVIRGADLLAHNKGRNSDLDEWLRDAAEEEEQSRRDESIGDDLFRYNPSKLTKRR
ncbi:hypothetical protein WMY93_026419 [Mugilogobius chulae]|uniref:FHA domain-containing protein n=1 Tax=Mugilogobius chulae TaxID=88201 RepID=A0AAW0N7F8_9GOBI